MARVAVVDYGLGNLYSVCRACEHAGMEPSVTGAADDLFAADAVVLPGVGAFADAMAALNERGLGEALQHLAGEGKPLFGVCLGLQLLMSESHEFGVHPGLGLIDGVVERLPADNGRKVPQVGWNRIAAPAGVDSSGSVLDGAEGTYVYFVHSYYVRPSDPSVVFSESRFGPLAFCSSVRQGNVFGCQFHPERSASQGLAIYRNMARLLAEGGCW